jgi:hypothetical protein
MSSNEGLTYEMLNNLTNHLYRNVPFASTQVWIGLLNYLQDEEVIFVDGTNYARQRLDDKMGEPVEGVSTSTEDIQFPISQTDWGTIRGIGLYDNESNLTIPFHAIPLPDPIEVGENVIVRFPAGSILLGFSK